MLQMPWLDKYHVREGTLDGAIAQANQLYWNLSVIKEGQLWLVYAGEDMILQTESRELVDAFLYGMGLAYGCLPEEVFGPLRDGVKRLVD